MLCNLYQSWMRSLKSERDASFFLSKQSFCDLHVPNKILDSTFGLTLKLRTKKGGNRSSGIAFRSCCCLQIELHSKEVFLFHLSKYAVRFPSLRGCVYACFFYSERKGKKILDQHMYVYGSPFLPSSS